MKRTLFILLALVVVASPFALGQFQDILGPHNVNGHGCASCHTPHSGAAGNDPAGDPSTGVTYLWGRSFIVGTYPTFGGESITTTSSYSETDPLFHTAACLSCHDGNVAIVGMNGTTFETTDGSTHVTTYLNKDGLGLANDHPVHVEYTPGSYNWPGTLNADGTITWGTDAMSNNWNTVYGHPARFYASGGQAYVECSTCHNPHSMNMARYKLNGVNVMKPSHFFVRGWYDSLNTSSNSATQFCRSCHYSKSNEYVGIASVTN
jgi:hypothetical protein